MDEYEGIGKLVNSSVILVVNINVIIYRVICIYYIEY